MGFQWSGLRVQVYQFSVAADRCYHKYVSENNTFILLQLERLEVQSQSVSLGYTQVWSAGLLLCLFQFLEVSRIPRLMAPSSVFKVHRSNLCCHHITFSPTPPVFLF